MSSPRSATVVVLHSHSGDTGRPTGTEALDDLAETRYVTEEDLVSALPGADVLLVWDFRSHALAHAWSAADSLRWVHASSAGVNHVLSAEVVASEVAVTNSRGVFDEPMAEYVLALALAMAKDLPTTLDCSGSGAGSTGRPSGSAARARSSPAPDRSAGRSAASSPRPA